MKLKNSINNVIWNLVYSIQLIIFTFIIRKQLMNIVGIELIGMTDILTQIITVFSLAELGISNVISYYLYEPLKDKNILLIKKYMAIFKKLYSFVGLLIVFIGLLFIPFLHFFINDYSININYYFVFILFLLNTSLSYLFSYKMVLMQADQKEYKYIKMMTSIKIIVFIIEIILINIFKNYYIYLIVDIICTLIMNYSIATYINTKYLFIKSLNKEKIPKDIIISIKNAFVSKISGVVTSSSDTIIIGILSTVTVLGYYSNYYVILYAIYKVIAKISNSVQSSIGSIIAEKNNEKIISTFNNINFIMFIIALSASLFYYCLIDQIICIWLGKEYLLVNIVSICLAIQLFVSIYKMNLWQFFITSGMFKVDKISSIIGCLSNIIISIILFEIIGVSGVVIGTIVSTIIQYIIKLKFFSNKFSASFENEALISLKYLLFYSLIIFVMILFKSLISNLIIIVISFFLILLLYKKTVELNYLKETIKYVFKNKKNI